MPVHRHRARQRAWGPLLAAASALAVLAQLLGLYAVAGPPSPPWFPSADKLAHAVAFALPVALILCSLRWYARGALARSVVVAVAVVFGAHAVLSEVIQLFFYADRVGDVVDVVADWAGVAAGLGGYLLVTRARAVGWQETTA